MDILLLAMELVREAARLCESGEEVRELTGDSTV